MAAYVSRIITSIADLKIESFSATHNRGYTPNTAELTIVTKKTEPCPFARRICTLFQARTDTVRSWNRVHILREIRIGAG